MAKINTLQDTLKAIATQLEKATLEITTKIQTLEDQLSNVDIPADAQATIDELKVDAQKLDDIVPDAPPPPPPPPTP